MTAPLIAFTRSRRLMNLTEKNAPKPPNPSPQLPTHLPPRLKNKNECRPFSFWQNSRRRQGVRQTPSVSPAQWPFDRTRHRPTGGREGGEGGREGGRKGADVGPCVAPASRLANLPNLKDLYSQKRLGGGLQRRRHRPVVPLEPPLADKRPPPGPCRVHLVATQGQLATGDGGRSQSQNATVVAVTRTRP